MTQYLRFHDLVQRGVVSNRATLQRWIHGQGFPPAVKLGPNTAAYPADEVEAWLQQRAAERDRSVAA